MRRLIVLAALLVALPARGLPRFVPLGILPGATVSYAYAVSADGSAVVGESFSPDGAVDEAFRWTEAGGIQGLGTPPTYSYATAVSADGSVVVGSRYSADTGGEEAFRWTEAGGMQALGSLPGAIYGYVAGVSADGSTVVGDSYSGDGLVEQAFRWTETGGLQALGVLPGATYSHAAAVSADGSVVAGESSSADGVVNEGFRWTQAGGLEGLGVLPGASYSGAYAVSADGSAVVGESSSADGVVNEGFRWTQAGGLQGLGVPPGASYSYAYAVSADGSVVLGGAYDPGYGGRSWIWDTSRGLRLIDQRLAGLGLDLTGWTLLDATAISSDGQVIVGTGSNPSGYREAWLADLSNVCGDGLVLGEEECDDANATGGDGCSETCLVEPGFGCSGTPSACALLPACSNGLDDDGDGFVDRSQDPGCESDVDDDEHSAAMPCDDGIDGDGDGKTDFMAAGGGDPGCASVWSVREDPQCQNGLDDDVRPGIDFDGGSSLDLDRDGLVDAQFNPATPPVGAADPQCAGAPWKLRESSGACGLGFELVVLAPLLARLGRKRRA